ncbi:hypothetical protein C1645_811888 [Glomus cerebriforme]|uniref:Uncharacterized protein n=1 Tax=Glomus cerebriforme TaxID=658196 RepID=A0A397TQE6_9GLOM|nr:hypothetical protein C1645_811888 [Glomus cerebriforme]
MNHFSLAYDAHSKYLHSFLEDFSEDFFEEFLEDSKHILQITMEDSNLIKVTAALIAVCLLMACSFLYYVKNKSDIKTSKIDNKNKIFSIPEEFNKSADDILTESSQATSQEKSEKDGSITKTLETPFTPLQEENDAMIKSSQTSHQEQDGAKIQESEDNPLASDSIELTPETTSQATCHKVVILSDSVHEPEANMQPKNHEEISEKLSQIQKTGSPIMEKGSNYMPMSKVESESEVSSHSDLSDIDDENVDSTTVETKSHPSPSKDACIQTEPPVSRSIILNDQIPVILPLPNETALDMLNEFRLSNVVHAFTGQDLIDLEEYDEEEEIRRFLFRKNI